MAGWISFLLACGVATLAQGDSPSPATTEVTRPVGVDQAPSRPAASPDWVAQPAAVLTEADDLNFQGLAPALARSLRYYKRLPPQQTFTLGDQTYTAAELAASVALFWDTIHRFRGAERQRLLQERFQVWESRNAEGGAFFTGYYEPLIPARLQPEGVYQAPVHGRPWDWAEQDGRVGRWQGDQWQPYLTRQEITAAGAQALAGRAPVLAFVDPVDLFFLQVQGSGLLQMPDDRRQRVGFAAHNGHPYVSIGRILVNRGLISADQISLQAIRQYLAANPEQVTDLFNENPRYVFFRRIRGGPYGALGVALTPGRSVAMDLTQVPRGSLAWMETVQTDGTDSGRPLRRFVLVQDTGAAIQGHGRVDIFWGQGPMAEQRAGFQRHPGRLFVIVAQRTALASRPPLEDLARGLDPALLTGDMDVP